MIRSSRRRIVLLPVLAGSIWACSSLFDLDALESGGPSADDGAAGSDAGSDGQGDATTPDTGADAKLDASPSTGCPSGEGPTMVRVDAFCIDSTEVTEAQYARFLASGDPSTYQPPSCVGNNTRFQSSAEAGAEYPAEGMNWCAAAAYCAWAGKRLCGPRGGADRLKATGDGPKEAGASEWHYACTKGGTQLYPYGPEYASRACNIGGDYLTPPTPVRGLPICEGGYPGIWDMVGNVAEYIDACDGPGPDDDCLAVGAARNGSRGDCTASEARTRTTISITKKGIRCCASPK